MNNNILLIRKKLKMTQAELSQKTGICRSYISNLETGKFGMKMWQLNKIAEALGVKPQDLIVDEDELRSSPITLKLYKEVLSDKGDTFTLEEESYITINVKVEILKKLSGIKPNNLIVLRCLGDSMLPTIDEDAYLIVDTSETNKIKHDGIYAFNYGGFFRVKRIQVIPDGFKVISDNKKYGTEFVGLTSNYELQIIGRVRGQVSNQWVCKKSVF